MNNDQDRDNPWVAWILRLIPVVSLLISMLSFRDAYWTVFKAYIGRLTQADGAVALFASQDYATSLGISVLNLFIGGYLFFLFLVFLISDQALLPVQDLLDVLMTAARFIFHMIGLHGAAVIIRDGKLSATARELQIPLPGVAVVDFNSAIVIERVVIPPGCIVSFFEFLIESWRRLWIWLRRPLPPSRAVRACGPGLFFLNSDERIQGVGDLDPTDDNVENVSGVVDLRRQFRVSRRQSDRYPEKLRTSVRAYTRDGIELNTNINAQFTIGQNPDRAAHVLHVTYVGEEIPDNLRVVAFDERGQTLQIRSIDDELEPDDKREIDGYFMLSGARLPYSNIIPGTLEPVFNPGRVFSAVYSQARKFTEGDIVLPWTELPVQVGTDFFREMLSVVNFDELFQMDARENIRVNQLRKQLVIRMRNNGLLCIRILLNGRGQPFVPGSFYPKRELLVSPIWTLTTRKVLREHGVQLLQCGFADLTPDETVFRQWLASWRSNWERDTLAAQAAADLEVSRILSRARVQTQEELWLGLRDIFMTDNNSMEVVALRVLQALESIAADKETRQLLPEETIHMLRNIHDWLLPQDGFPGTASGNQPAPTPTN